MKQRTIWKRKSDLVNNTNGFVGDHMRRCAACAVPHMSQDTIILHNMLIVSILKVRLGFCPDYI